MTRAALRSVVGLVLLAMAAGAGACQGLADQTTRGTPLLTVRGTITRAPDFAVEGELRVALIWYPRLLQNAVDTAAPACDFAVTQGFVSQGVAYRPTFPIDYAVDITAVPPRQAQQAIDGGAGARGALGALVVYQDGNGNGALDACSDGSGCVDRVLGASGSVAVGGLPGGQVDSLIGYTDAIRGGFFLMHVGLNPVSTESTILPLPGTSVDVTLADAPILKALTCERLCIQIAGGSCAVADQSCAAPFIPKAAPVHCEERAPARYISWLTIDSDSDGDGCTVTSHGYLVEEGRPLPPWWPCP